MSGLIDWLTSLISANPLLVAGLVGILATLESLLVIGGVVPGTTVLLAIAAAAGASGHSLWPMFFAATVGAVIGDGVSYWIGRRYGDRIAAWGPLARRPHLLASAEAHFRRRGAMSVAIARFVPGLRAIMPAAAGMLNMSPTRFTIANVASAVVWSALHVFGAGLAGDLFARVGGWFTAALLGAVVALVLLVWLARQIARATLPLAARAGEAVHRWAARRDDPGSRLLARTLAPDNPTTLLTLLWSGLLITALLVFAGLLEDVQEGDPIVQADLVASRFIDSLRTPALDHAMVFVTMFGDPVVLASVASAVVAWLLWRRHWWVAIAFSVAALLPVAFVPLVKATLGRTRPLGELYSGAEVFSFPSGHATNSAVLLALLGVLIGGALKGSARWAVGTVFAVMACGIAFSRVYLQAHWPSDVVAGLSFAAAIGAAFVLALGRMRPEDIRPAGLAAVAALAAIVVGGAHIATGHARAVERYAPRDLSVEIAPADWRTGGWRDVARGRVSFLGKLEAQFIVQWVGDRAPLEALLEREGWRRAPEWSAGAVSSLASAHTPLAAIPPIPQLHIGLSAVEVWVKDAGDERRLVFRLWPSDHDVGGRTLYVGAVEGERTRHSFGLFTLLDAEPVDPAAVTALADAIRADPAAAPHALVVEGLR